MHQPRQTCQWTYSRLIGNRPTTSFRPATRAAVARVRLSPSPRNPPRRGRRRAGCANVEVRKPSARRRQLAPGWAGPAACFVPPGSRLQLGRGAESSPLLEALAAIHGPTLRRLEGNRGFLPALRAGRLRFRTLEIPRASGFRAFGFARLAPLGLVLEALVGEKHLLAGGEHKLGAALRALQDLIVVFHLLLRSPALGAGQAAC